MKIGGKNPTVLVRERVEREAEEEEQQTDKTGKKYVSSTRQPWQRSAEPRSGSGCKDGMKQQTSPSEPINAPSKVPRSGVAPERRLHPDCIIP